MNHKPRIFIYMHYMELGGAERALLGLLNALDTEKVDVDLFLNQHTGDFMSLIPSKIHLLPELKGYNAIERSMKDVFMEGQWKVVWKRIRAKWLHRCYHKTLNKEEQDYDSSVYQYVMDEVTPILPSLEYLGEYDLAISFLQPHNIVLDKVRAKRKICWIHTDYKAIHINALKELKNWEKFDAIASISEHCSQSFVECFPTLGTKLFLMENILSPSFVRHQADVHCVPELASISGVKIVSVGRICHAKNYDNIPYVAKQLKDKGLDFHWFIVGPGDASSIRNILRETHTEDVVQFLGARSNPYPYIKACDIYVQPSRYEGKSVTVREAQMLCKPVIITNYATAASQVKDGYDGVICEMDNESIAESIYELVLNKEKQSELINYCSTHDFGNENEVDKIYSFLDLK